MQSAHRRQPGKRCAHGTMACIGAGADDVQAVLFSSCSGCTNDPETDSLSLDAIIIPIFNSLFTLHMNFYQA